MTYVENTNRVPLVYNFKRIEKFHLEWFQIEDI